jgi:hypothetical protein
MVNRDVEKLHLKELVADFMNTNEMVRRIRNMINGTG